MIEWLGEKDPERAVIAGNRGNLLYFRSGNCLQLLQQFVFIPGRQRQHQHQPEQGDQIGIIPHGNSLEYYAIDRSIER